MNPSRKESAAKVPELDVSTLAVIPGNPETLADLDDYGETLEPLDPSDLSGFIDLDGLPIILLKDAEALGGR